MRLLYPRTLEIIAKESKDNDFNGATVSRKQVISHAWSEVLKYLATNQKHPKMFLTDNFLGIYMKLVKSYGDMIGCNLNEKLLIKYDAVWYGYTRLEDSSVIAQCLMSYFEEHDFDISYLFSDAMSLYLKGVNIFPYIYGDNWRKYVPIESLKEIQRVVTKTIDKRSK